MTGPELYLLDTNAISHMMRDPQGMVAQRVLSAVAQGQQAKVCTSVIVQCELLFGLRKRPNPRWQTQYHRVMASIEVRSLEPTVAACYAELRSQLESQGTPMSGNDTLIAAHALALDATLVSADAAFARVPGLQVENWLS